MVKTTMVSKQTGCRMFRRVALTVLAVSVLATGVSLTEADRDKKDGF